jgi:hypothetical protein
VFLFLVAFFAFALSSRCRGFSRHGGSEPCVERRFREIRTDGVEKR